jgi:hypothetical protein
MKPVPSKIVAPSPRQESTGGGKLVSWLKGRSGQTRFASSERSIRAECWLKLSLALLATEPSSTFLVLSTTLTIYLASSIFFPTSANPARPFLLLSHQIPSLPSHYAKGPLDVLFCAFYTVFFFFIRQLSTRHLFPPLARRLGINKSVKIDRFVEQAYAVLTWGPLTVWGIQVMRGLGLGWFRTAAFFEREYLFPLSEQLGRELLSSFVPPDYENHHQMPAQLKAYYLVQSSFWISQMMVLVFLDIASIKSKLIYSSFFPTLRS